jgi:hypothetical protein
VVACGSVTTPTDKELFERHHLGVFRFFTTFLAAREGLQRLRFDSSFKTWLFGIACNKLLNHLNNRSRNQQRFDPDANSVAKSSPLHRRCWMPNTANGCCSRRTTIADVARVVDKPVNTVKTQLEELMREYEE